MKITLAVDEKVVERARAVALAQGKSLNHMLREYLEQLAGSAQLQAEIDAFKRSAMNTPGRRRGWKFNREEIQRFA